MAGQGRPRSPAHRIKHGTTGGYTWHLRYNVPMCEKCRKANAANSKFYRQKAKRDRTRLRRILAHGYEHKRNRLTNVEADLILKALKLVSTKAERKEMGL